MRKYNVFGKKNKQNKPLIILAILFLIVIISYVIILVYSTTTISRLQTENSQLQQNINVLLLNEQSATYRTVEELIPYLPNEFKQATIYNEIILTRDLSGLLDADNFNVDFNLDSDNPFDETINDNLKFVKITISFSTSDPTLALDFIDNMISLDRLYYLQSYNINILSNDNTMVNLDFYTFYIPENS